MSIGDAIAIGLILFALIITAGDPDLADQFTNFWTWCQG